MKSPMVLEDQNRKEERYRYWNVQIVNFLSFAEKLQSVVWVASNVSIGLVFPIRNLICVTTVEIPKIQSEPE